MPTKTWTCTIKNGSTETLQAPNGLDVLTGGNPTGSPPQWNLAPGGQTTLSCSLDSGQQNGLRGSFTWAGASGSAQLNWLVPYSGAPTYAPGFTGYAVTTGDSSPTGVTYTITGGAASTGAPSAPPGTPARVVPTSGSTALSKADAPQLWILGDLNGDHFPHFNCGYYSSTVDDKLIGEETYGAKVDNPHDALNNPRKAPDGSVMANGKNTHYRTLQTSGCGLFALSSILGGYDCIVPDWDDKANQFKSTAVKGTVDMRTPTNETNRANVGPDKQLGSPRAFLQFIWHYVIQNNAFGISTEAQAKEDLRPRILAPDGPGALYFGGPLCAAIGFMFTYHPWTYDAEGKPRASPPAFGMTFSSATNGNWPGGTEIKEVSDSIITQHQPVIIGIGSESSSHQVLVVGLVKYGGKTYYITIDSGFSGDQHPGGLLSMSLPLSWTEIVKYTVSASAAWSRKNRPNIFWWRAYTGNDASNQAFDFTLFCKQVREW